MKLANGPYSVTRLLPALTSGLMMTAAFPRPELSWLAWVALVPLLYSLRDLPAGRRFAAGFTAGWVHYLTLGYWLIATIMVYGGVPLVPALLFYLALAACLAGYLALFALFLGWSAKKPPVCLLTAPFLWVGLEYLRAHLFSGLPWALLGHSQYKRLYLIQIADIAGVYGLSFVIVLVNAAITCLLLRLRRQSWRGSPTNNGAVFLMGALAVTALVLTWGYGRQRLRAVDRELLRAPRRLVAVVQGNIDQAQKWDFPFRLASVEKHLALAEKTTALRPDLIVMPETALPFYFFYEKGLTDLVCQRVREMGVSLLAGAPAYQQVPGGMLFYNSAFLIRPDGKAADRYDKTHLVPFGEYVPFGSWLPFIDKLVAGVGDFTPGEASRVIKLNGCGLAVQICYEIIFPDICRRMVQHGADIIINITNDAWYGKTAAPYQHFSMTVFRAVENRRSLVRSANTGISGFIDPAGRIRASTGLFVEAAAVYEVPVLTVPTIYAAAGDLPAKSCVILTLIVICRRSIRRFFKKKDEESF